MRRMDCAGGTDRVLTAAHKAAARELRHTTKYRSTLCKAPLNLSTRVIDP